MEQGHKKVVKQSHERLHLRETLLVCSCRRWGPLGSGLLPKDCKLSAKPAWRVWRIVFI